MPRTNTRQPPSAHMTTMTAWRRPGLMLALPTTERLKVRKRREGQRRRRREPAIDRTTTCRALLLILASLVAGPAPLLASSPPTVLESAGFNAALPQRALFRHWQQTTAKRHDAAPLKTEAPPRIRRIRERPALPTALAERRQRYAALIDGEARRQGLDPALVHAVIRAESSYRPRARSPAGACGLMQLMPATAARFGVTDLWEPAENIRGGVTYLRFLMDRFDGDLRLVLAAYNAGEGAVAKYADQIPPYRETQQYVHRVLGYLEKT